MSSGQTTILMTSPPPWTFSNADRDLLTTSVRLTSIPDLTFVCQTSAKKGETLLMAYCERTTASLGPESTERTWMYTTFPSKLGAAPESIIKVDTSVIETQREIFKQCFCPIIRHAIEGDQLLMGNKRVAALTVIDTLPNDEFDTIAGVIAEGPGSTSQSGRSVTEPRTVRVTQGPSGYQHYQAVRGSGGKWEWMVSVGHLTEPTFESHKAVLKGSIGAAF